MFLTAAKQAAIDFQEDECMLTGAALSYYTIFSLPPLLVLVFMVAQWAGVHRTTIDEVVGNQLGVPTAADSTEGDKSQLLAAAERTHDESGGLIGRLIGFGILAFSATGVLAQLQLALNRAWDVTPDPDKGGVLNFVVKRLLSLGMIVVFALLLLVSLVLTTLIDELIDWFAADADGIVWVLSVAANVALSLLLATVLFALVFRILPDAKVEWRHVRLGAFVTAVLFVVGKFLIALYLQRSHVGSQWGSAAGSMVGVLVWVYYNSLLVLYGAEFTQAWSRAHGDWPEAEELAESTVDQAEIEERCTPDSLGNSQSAVAASSPFETTAIAGPTPDPDLPNPLDDPSAPAGDTAHELRPSTTPKELPMPAGTLTAQDRVFFKLQMINLTRDPEQTLAGVHERLEKTLEACTQFDPNALVTEHLDELDDALRSYVEEFDAPDFDFAELCDVINDDIARCNYIISRVGSETRLVELDGETLVQRIERTDAGLVDSEEFTVRTEDGIAAG